MQRQPKGFSTHLVRNLIFLVALLGIWYYLMTPYIKGFSVFQKNADKLKIDRVALMQPKSGREVLPEEAQVALFAIDSFHLKDYKLYKTLGDYAHPKGNVEFLFQRITESAWPVQLDTNSRNLIGFTDELSLVPGIKMIIQYNNTSVGTY